MPRLLLVDDNPSIHRIAESLLAPTDIELICADSAEDALDRLARGERFDVALVDTVMPGMDGWSLLARLRGMEATARLPIALMAGVLDPVDPAKLAKAPVQGFLKKPIELRELGDRVKALLAMPVPAPEEPSPFATLPSTPIKDLIHAPESAPLPEFRPGPPIEPQPMEELPDLPSLDEDLLVLGAEDLWPEVPEPVAERPMETVPEVQLELEELDLESLQDLTEEPLVEAEGIPELSSDLDLTDDQAAVFPVIESVALPEEREEPTAISAHDTQDLDLGDAVTLETPLSSLVPASALAVEPLPESMEDEELDLLSDEPVLPAATGQMPAVQGPPAEPVLPLPAPSLSPAPAPAETRPQAASAEAQALLQALLAEPVLMEALTKALVARMGDQVLREIAWEVMPELAERLQR